MRVVEQCNQPIEEWRIEVREAHAAEVSVRPAEGVGEDRCAVELREGVVAAAIPCLRSGSAP